MDLFNETRHLPLDGAQVVYHPAPNLGMSADELFNLLRRDIVWEQHSIQIEDRIIPQPRLSCWFPRRSEPVGVRTKTWTTKEVVHVFLRRQTSSG